MYRTIELTPFGVLRAKGKSKVWQTSLPIPYLGGDFQLVIHGDVNGPSASQRTALTLLIEPSEALRDEIATKVVEFIHACNIVPAEFKVDVATVWSLLTPELIEVHTSHEYAYGACELGNNAISIGYLTPWTNEQLIQVPFLNGKIGVIYSE
ncbi:hypothetical protein [Shewanella sp. Koi 1]